MHDPVPAITGNAEHNIEQRQRGNRPAARDKQRCHAARRDHQAGHDQHAQRVAAAIGDPAEHQAAGHPGNLHQRQHHTGSYQTVLRLLHQQIDREGADTELRKRKKAGRHRQIAQGGITPQHRHAGEQIGLCRSLRIAIVIPVAAVTREPQGAGHRVCQHCKQRNAPTPVHSQHRRYQRNNRPPQRHAGLLDREHQIAMLRRAETEQQMRRAGSRQRVARADENRRERHQIKISGQSRRHARGTQPQRPLHGLAGAPAQNDIAHHAGGKHRGAEQYADLVTDHGSIDAEHFGQMRRDDRKNGDTHCRSNLCRHGGEYHHGQCRCCAAHRFAAIIARLAARCASSNSPNAITASATTSMKVLL